MCNSMELHAGDGLGNPSDNRIIDSVKQTPRTTELEIPSIDQCDAQALARLGKKSVLKVCNSWASMLLYIG